MDRLIELIDWLNPRLIESWGKLFSSKRVTHPDFAKLLTCCFHLLPCSQFLNFCMDLPPRKVVNILKLNLKILNSVESEQVSIKSRERWSWPKSNWDGVSSVIPYTALRYPSTNRSRRFLIIIWYTQSH